MWDFPNPESNQCLLHCKADSPPLDHQESPSFPYVYIWKKYFVKVFMGLIPFASDQWLPNGVEGSAWDHGRTFTELHVPRCFLLFIKRREKAWKTYGNLLIIWKLGVGYTDIWISYSLYFALHIEILGNTKWAKNIIHINNKGILSLGKIPQSFQNVWIWVMIL